jgi:hypothetical protein
MASGLMFFFDVDRGGTYRKTARASASFLEVISSLADGSGRVREKQALVGRVAAGYPIIRRRRRSQGSRLSLRRTVI